jgi:ornithine carbamoyltransferase
MNMFRQKSACLAYFKGETMPRAITTIEAMGKDLAWTLVQQARGIPDAKAIDDFLTDRSFLVLFAKHDLTERLCITAAISQMSGSSTYMGPEESWMDVASAYPEALLGAMSYYVDGIVLHGLMPTVRDLEEVKFPILNVGSVDAHPCHALADILCMMRYSHGDLSTQKLCWLGYPSGAMYSLMAATKFFPFSMSLCFPEKFDAAAVQAKLDQLKTDVVIHNSVESAVAGCQYIVGGSADGMSFDEKNLWRISKDLLAKSGVKSRVMAGTNPMHCLPVDMSVVAEHNDLFLLQSENKLRVYKRMLHWLIGM